MYTLIITPVIIIIISLICELKYKDLDILECVGTGLLFGSILGFIIMMALPKDYKTITTTYKITPINEKYAIGYDIDNDLFTVNTTDTIRKFTTVNTFKKEYIKIKYNNNYIISITELKESNSWINKFAEDFYKDKLIKIIIEIPENSVDIKYNIKNNN